jgi:putative membrane protein
MMWGYWGGAGSWLGPTAMVLFWVLVVAGIVALVRSYGRSSQSRPDRAHEILRERYARGEISRQELEELQHGLTVK